LSRAYMSVRTSILEQISLSTKTGGRLMIAFEMLVSAAPGRMILGRDSDWY
jgi:hypothetical protein